jgi:hypothetical protein
MHPMMHRALEVVLAIKLAEKMLLPTIHLQTLLVEDEF